MFSSSDLCIISLSILSLTPLSLCLKLYYLAVSWIILFFTFQSEAVSCFILLNSLFWWASYWWKCTAHYLEIGKPMFTTTRQSHSTCFITPCSRLTAFYCVCSWCIFYCVCSWCIYLYVLATKYHSSIHSYLEHKYTHILGKPGHTHL